MIGKAVFLVVYLCVGDAGDYCYRDEIRLKATRAQCEQHWAIYAAEKYGPAPKGVQVRGHFCVEGWPT